MEDELLCLLMSYEMDAPHHSYQDMDLVEDQQWYPDIDMAKVNEWLAMEHCGDCVKLPAACPRCYAEQARHKARWLADRIRNKGSEMLTIKFKKLHPDAKAPTKAHDLDAGWDLYATGFNDGDGIRTGIAVEIPPGYYGQIQGRSSLAKKFGVNPRGGVVDCTYRGEIVVLIDLHGFTVGDKIAQLVILPVPQVEFVEVEELGASERGEKGFGSSGR